MLLQFEVTQIKPWKHVSNKISKLNDLQNEINCHIAMRLSRQSNHFFFFFFFFFFFGRINFFREQVHKHKTYKSKLHNFRSTSIDFVTRVWRMTWAVSVWLAYDLGCSSMIYDLGSLARADNSCERITAGGFENWGIYPKNPIMCWLGWIEMNGKSHDGFGK